MITIFTSESAGCKKRRILRGPAEFSRRKMPEIRSARSATGKHRIRIWAKPFISSECVVVAARRVPSPLATLCHTCELDFRKTKWKIRKTVSISRTFHNFHIVAERIRFQISRATDFARRISAVMGCINSITSGGIVRVAKSEVS